MNRKRPHRIPFPHPGETIREDFLKPLGMSVNKLALELRVPATRLTEIVNGRRGITADTALRLARYFQYHAPLLAQPPGLLRTSQSGRG